MRDIAPLTPLRLRSVFWDLNVINLLKAYDDGFLCSPTERMFLVFNPLFLGTRENNGF
jgi:hypothetical protein